MDKAETEDLHALTDARPMARMRIVLTLLKKRYSRVDSLMEGEPVVLVENGRPLQERMDLERVDLDDILEAACSPSSSGTAMSPSFPVRMRLSFLGFDRLS